MNNKWFGFFIIMSSLGWPAFAMQKQDVGRSKATKKSKKVKHESIWRAASNGNLERIKIWLQKDPTLLHALDEYGQSPLYWAVSKNRLEAIHYLLDQGADCNTGDTLGKTGLHRVNQVKTAQLLLQAGADPNTQDTLGKTPLHWIDNEQISRLLIKAGAGVNIGDNEGKTALHWAAGMGHLNIVKELIRASADINAQDKEGKTPLHAAVITGNYVIVQFLLSQKGIDINAQDYHKKRSALHWAGRMCKGAVEKKRKLNSVCLTGHMIIALVSNGADQDVLDYRNRTPARRLIFMQCSDYEKNLLHMALQYNSLTESHQKKLLDHLKMLEL